MIEAKGGFEQRNRVFRGYIFVMFVARQCLKVTTDT